MNRTRKKVEKKERSTQRETKYGRGRKKPLKPFIVDN